MQNAMQDASKCDANAYVIADANATNRKRPTGDFGIPYWLDAGPERTERSAKLRQKVVVLVVIVTINDGLKFGERGKGKGKERIE